MYSWIYCTSVLTSSSPDFSAFHSRISNLNGVMQVYSGQGAYKFSIFGNLDIDEEHFALPSSEFSPSLLFLISNALAKSEHSYF